VTTPRRSESRGSIGLRILLLAYPKSLRRQWGPDIVRFLSRQRQEPRYNQGAFGAIRFYKDVLSDILSNAVRHDFSFLLSPTGGSKPPRKRIDKERDKSARGAGFIDGIVQDFVYAKRVLIRSPLFTLAAVATLAVGIGANVAMFSVLDAVLIRALPYPSPERLVYGRATFGDRVNSVVSYPDYIDFRDRSDAFESLALIRSGLQSFPVTGLAEPERVSGNWVTVDFFPALGVDPQLGRQFTTDEGEPGAPDVMLISHGYWRRRFGSSPDVVGRTISVEGYPTTIIGVMPADYRFRYDTDIWLPIRDGYMDTGGRSSHSWQIVGRLRSDVSLEQAQSQVNVIASQLAEAYPESHENKGLLLTELDEALVEGYRPNLILLMAATGLVLLIACGNVANLLLARGSTRKLELSARAALGASRARLIRQFMTESALLAILAGSVGTVLALWLQQLIVMFMPMDSLGIREIGMSAPMLGFALAASLATAIVFGIGPALTASQANPAATLNNGLRASAHARATRIRSGLVVLQVALTVVLIAASGLLVKSFMRLKGVDVGFDTNNLLTASVQISSSDYDPEARTRFYRTLLEDVRSIPGAESASAISHIPVVHPFMDWSAWDPENPPPDPSGRVAVYSRTMLPGYFAAMGIPILRGRDHEDADEANPQQLLVINQAAAERLFPGKDPVGRRVTIYNHVSGPEGLEVIGVVGDARITSLDRAPAPQMYFNHANSAWSSMNLVVRAAGNPTSLAPGIRAAVLELDRNVPLSNVATMTDLLSESLESNRVVSIAIGLFGAVALLLATFGLYGVLAYYVTRRTQEIGVRVALGATGSNVMWSVVGRGLVLVAAGLAVGLPASVVVTRVLRSQLYEVVPTDPLTYAGVVVCLLLTGTVACLVPARRAVRIDPVVALKAE
jgi:putative ABC transport system permease protein